MSSNRYFLRSASGDNLSGGDSPSFEINPGSGREVVDLSRHLPFSFDPFNSEDIEIAESPNPFSLLSATSNEPINEGNESGSDSVRLG